MQKNQLENMQIGSTADLFSSEEQRQSESTIQAQDLSIDLIDDFPNQPFKIRMDEEMAELVDSIREVGVLMPVLVRPKDGRYEMISGHRRKIGSNLAQITTIPSIIRELTDYEAIIIMVDSNLQRTNISMSEKAWAYRMKNDAIKHQGKHRPMGEKLSITEISKQHQESERTIQRYIRLTHLIPEIMDLIDNNKISFRPAVEISFLDENEQKDLLETIESEDCTPSITQAKELHRLSDSGELNIDKILDILSQEKPNQKEKIVLPHEHIKKYFSKDATPREILEQIMRLLEKDYIKKKNRGER